MSSYVKDRDDMPEFQAGKDAATQASAQAKELQQRFTKIVTTFDPAQRLTAQQINVEAARHAPPDHRQPRTGAPGGLGRLNTPSQGLATPVRSRPSQDDR